ncbi:cytochrome P450 monooxygenase [Fomitiporia mediterranea MF3/22]|uniref:cytochrome P450 monooxygenase n=1 Tax=Fomitiporia mediterranea (strain MF3/22) TaxID=694068 RepID=UPI0004408403|nr:cytochrome P450 monooxygenase [Fomitiporia mediterranea MF3/22]EJC98992.1 cytochrome P450 monooxygenase [Fomitiporia mediterranea MF3/22]
MAPFTLVDLILALVGLYVVKSFLNGRRFPAPLPPGPKGKPLIGNLKDLPSVGEQEWLHWDKHKYLYGPISSVTVSGQTMVIISDKQIAFDLMDKRSTITSSRPGMVFAGEMVGWENALSSLTYSDRFRAYRKNVRMHLGTKQAVSRLNLLQDIEVRRFLLRVLEEPDKLFHHIRTAAGAIILKITYGYTIEPRGSDPLVGLADEALIQFCLATVPGAWLVDTLPFLRYLPDWIPGMDFKRTAARWRKTITEVAEKPYAFVNKQMADGAATPSYTSKLLNKDNLSPEEQFVVKWSAASLYSGGADTTVSSMMTFFLAMTMYPEVQRKAQEQIDCVIGNDRLPGFNDREELPYVNAIVKEVLRWHPIVPMGLPHMTTEDDIYNGHFIPKGSLLMPNIWGFMHDQNTYHDPMTFKPERFLGVDGRSPEMDPHQLGFGFGRRVCPGRELADSSLYLTIVQSLSVFNISKAVENGKEVEPVVGFTSGIVSHPLEYRTSVKPRSSKAEALIRSVEEEYPFQSGSAKLLNGIKV